MFRRLLPVAVLVCGALTGVTTGASAGPAACGKRNNNTVNKLLECVTVDGVREHQAVFQAIADANGGVRASGTPGYDQSADYVAGLLEDAGYDVRIQEFEFESFTETSEGILEQVLPVPTAYPVNELAGFATMSYTGSGDVTAPTEAVDLDLDLGNTSTSGCEPDDFTGFTNGNIAIVQRGACSFFQKAANAEAAGAVGVVIFNQGNADGRFDAFNGTLGGSGVTIPVVGAAFAVGVELAGEGVTARIAASGTIETTFTSNILAETPGGDASNVVMVGAHLDSVDEGPGINDNGSGSAAILEVALQMAKVKPVNKVRFAWWGAEESGLVGSTEYIFSTTEEEFFSIALYLNFDMVGSPNYMFGIYDGDDSDGVGAGPGPEGSAQIEKTFETYYDSVGEPYQGTDFSGRSDYGPFIQFGIPAGGLFTGAEGIKSDAEAALYGGTAGDQYDPCYHLACDTFENVSLHALDVNSDAIAYATLNYAMSTELVNGGHSKGNFKPSKGLQG